MNEKRSFPRVGVSFPVECKVLSAKNYFYTVSKDLSLGGVKIVSNRFLPKDNTVKININLIDSILGLKTRVAWCNKERFSERYSTGLQFVETNEPSKKQLFQFLNRIFSV
jgi:c-di-GMP-binding flagellar brake protein YcgR